MEKKNDLKTNEYLRGIVLNLPEGPGIYQYLDKEGTIIYVGKAKNLKRRVYSYFSKDHESAKTRMLVSKIVDIRYIVVNTEEDALLLENNLIKKYKPRYNVLLKDDKTYPSICVTNEYLPRVFVTRNIVRDGSTYFGPYSHVGTMKTLLGLIKNLYTVRQCKHVFKAEKMPYHKCAGCIYYNIKRCKGPCEGKQTREDYIKMIDEVKEILKGNTHVITESLEKEMDRLSEALLFEEAQVLNEKYELIENYRSGSEVLSDVAHDVDVFSIETEEESSAAYINYLHIRKGCINQAFTFEYKVRMDETKEELLQLGITEMRERYHSKAKEIIVPFELDMEMNGVTFTIPQRGQKKHLLNLSVLNVGQYKADRLKQAEKLNPEQKSVRLMKELQALLHLEKLPMHIECFDNSNIQGMDAVAGCVVYKKARKSKSDYRKYNIKTVVGPDDYASMKEVVYRRYSRILAEEGELPDLILTDGGKGQMEVVRQVIEDELHLNIAIAGLAKDDHHRTNELLYGFPPAVVGLKQGTPLFRFLEEIQTEVHNYAIRFHRNKRSKTQVASALDHIKGIGQKRKADLLKHFKSVTRIKEASEEELAKVVGNAVAKTLKESL